MQNLRLRISLVVAFAVLIPFLLHRKHITQTADHGAQGLTPGQDLVRNGGFESPGSPAPDGWSWDRSQSGSKGTVSQDHARFHSGHASLKMQLNNKNDKDHPLAVGQMFPAGAYRGQKVEFSAYLLAEGDATAVLGMLSIVGGRLENLVAVTQSSGGSDWVRQGNIYLVPDDPSAQLAIICSVAGHSGAAWFDDVSVMPYAERGPEASTNRSQGLLQASIQVDAGTVIRQIPRTLYGTNMEWGWNANAMWLEQERRANPEMVRLTRELGVSLIRYPGGLYSDFYHWKDGIGPYEKRPLALHEPIRKDRSRPNFGTDELLDFAAQVGAEPLITVNVGTGTAQEAADWVRYVNTKALRVRYWEVGNELYINDGSVASKAITMNPATYAARFLEFARAMRAADPRIKIGAIGGENQGHYRIMSYPDWNRTLLETAGDQIDFLAVHNAYAPGISQDREELRDVYRALLGAPILIGRNLQTLAEQIAKYVPARASQIPIAVTEWGPLFQVDPAGKYVDHTKTLGSAVFAASTLKVFVESPHTEIANFHVLNDFGFMGWIGSRNGNFPPNPDWAPTARYYAFQLFTRHFGDQLVRSEAAGPSFDSNPSGGMDAVKDVPYLGVVSSLSADGRKLFVIAINQHFDSPIEGAIAIRGFAPVSNGTTWTLTGTGIDANTGTTPIKPPGLVWGNQIEDKQNPHFHNGGPGEITLVSSPVSGIAAQFNYRFPPHSVTSLELSRSGGRH